MFANSIDGKPLFTRPDGDVLVDLTQTMIDLSKEVNLSYSPFKVPKDYAMRPDLISKAVYNTTSYAEIILKFNGISNPFTINEGDIILVPNLDAANEKMVSATVGTQTEVEKIRNSYKYIDPTKIPSKSTELQSYDQRQFVLPPNIAEDGTTQITQRNGRVYFGESVATCVKNGISSAEYLALAIKNKTV